MTVNFFHLNFRLQRQCIIHIAWHTQKMKFWLLDHSIRIRIICQMQSLSFTPIMEHGLSFTNHLIITKYLDSSSWVKRFLSSTNSPNPFISLIHPQTSLMTQDWEQKWPTGSYLWQFQQKSFQTCLEVVKELNENQRKTSKKRKVETLTSGSRTLQNFI